MPDDNRIVEYSFDDIDDRPLPLIVADRWGFSLACQEYDGRVWYAVQDWIAGITISDNTRASRLWADMKDKPAVESVVSIVSLPYVASDGKTYQREHTTDKGLYVIAQQLRSLKKRGAIDDVKAFLAAAGVIMDEIRRNPDIALDLAAEAYSRQGKSEAWIQNRLDGKVKRRAFTDALRAAVRDSSAISYGAATNEIYLGLWERTAAELRGEIGLKKHQKLRDFQHELALMYESIVESVAAHRMGNNQELEWDEARAIVHDVASMIGFQARQTGNYLGVDLPTNRPLLSE